MAVILEACNSPFTFYIMLWVWVNKPLFQLYDVSHVLCGASFDASWLVGCTGVFWTSRSLSRIVFLHTFGVTYAFRRNWLLQFIQFCVRTNFFGWKFSLCSDTYSLLVSFGSLKWSSVWIACLEYSTWTSSPLTYHEVADCFLYSLCNIVVDVTNLIDISPSAYSFLSLKTCTKKSLNLVAIF